MEVLYHYSDNGKVQVAFQQLCSFFYQFCYAIGLSTHHKPMYRVLHSRKKNRGLVFYLFHGYHFYALLEEIAAQYQSNQRKSDDDKNGLYEYAVIKPMLFFQCGNGLP
jgi:hypothetical protein